VLYKSEVLESWGRSISLTINECRRVGIPDPEIHTDGSAVWMIFHYTRSTVGKNPTITPQVNVIFDIISYRFLSVKEIMELKDRKSFLYGYLYPAIESSFVELLYPENPKYPKQKYRLTDKGKGL